MFVRFLARPEVNLAPRICLFFLEGGGRGRGEGGRVGGGAVALVLYFV